MVRKAEHAGVQKNRYVRKVLEVAEDIMSEPLKRSAVSQEQWPPPD
jgi:hypothetical protein